MSDDYLYEGTGTPDPEIKRLEELLAPHAYRPRRRFNWMAPFAIAAVLCVAVATPFLFDSGESGPSWAVEWLDGGGSDRLVVGDWLQTDASSRARIAVADIGHVEVQPESRVRLVGTGADEHRMELSRGRLDAVVYAPPRLFVVDTPSATAVDLGCAYSLEVDESGRGLLQVVTGYVELESAQGASWVPGGASCRLRPGAGPGVPFFDGVDAALLDPAGGAAFEEALQRARSQDSLSIWHLLARVAAERRGQLYDRLVKLAPPPPEVTRELALALDADSLTAWREFLPLR